jgi:RNA polymerase sigma factor (sigma-70 family)
MSPHHPRDEAWPAAAEANHLDAEDNGAVGVDAGGTEGQVLANIHREPPSSPAYRSPDAGEPLPETFASFYERTRVSAYQAVLVATGDSDRSRDAVDEAFARALARWDRVSQHPCPKGWVIRTAINQHRTWWKRVGAHEIPDDNLAVAAPTATSFDPELIKAIGRLPPRQREVVGLRYLADLTPTEIADVLEIDPRTVSVHHHRAMRALRAMLEDG